MHPRIYAAFERLLTKLHPSGRFLEIGAVPNDESLLAMKCLDGQHKVGVNLDKASRYKDFEILQANANDMSRLFETGSFDCVLSNATLEHDKHFWLTCAEIRRVLRPNGLAVIGVPGFANSGNMSALGLRNPWPNDPMRTSETATLTLLVHNYPGDYWRFSEQAVREIFFAGFQGVVVRPIMVPPRIIGWGYNSP